MRRLLLALLLALAGLTAPVGPRAAAAAPAVAWTDGQGLHVVSATPEGDRLWRLVVSTSALSQPVRVNVLLPAGYDGSRRYPVLYLFHGTSGGAGDWVDVLDAAAATAAYPLVVVMPDSGYAGNGGSWFTDWVDQDTRLGAARWETFHVRQLVRYVDAHVRTVPERSARAVAGLSQGGFGALSYAARHPDTFVAAAGFSPAADVFRDPRARAAGTAVVASTMTQLNGVQAYAPFGDPATRALTWQGHNPASLVGNLAASDVALWCGTGAPGPLDPPGTPYSGTEALVRESTTYFLQAAGTEGVRVGFTDYGAGTHSAPYWARDLRQWLPRLQAVLDARRADPRRITHAATERRWRQWGWTVRNTGREGWTGLVRAGRRGFTFTGRSGVVSTPRRYQPGAAYAVTWSRGSGSRRVVADGRGRLRLSVTAERGRATAKVRAAGGGAGGRSR